VSKLRVLGVGAGYFSQFQYLGWPRIAEVDCVGIVNRDAAKARALADRFGIGAVFGDLKAALDATQPDLVDIITPPATHNALVGECVARGVPVICQKPFGRDYADAVAMTEMAKAAGVPLVIHENIRWQPWYREARRLIDAGHFGALHCVAFRLRPGDGQGARAYLDRQPYFQQMPQFLVKETAIHWIDTFRYLAGEVKTVYAALRRLNPVIAGEDAGLIVFEFESGSTGLFDGNRLNDHVASNPRRTMGEAWIEGAAGVLRLDGQARLWWKPHQAEEAEHRYDRGPDDTFGGGACEWLQRHVVAHFRSGAALENSARDYLHNLRVQEAVYRSAATHRRVEIAGFDALQASAPNCS
jgi:predicted dehydrogenase